MKRVKKKFCVKLIVIICLILALFNFIGGKKVYAANSEDDKVFGGVLLRPIMHLLTSIGDGTMDILHKTVLEQDTSIIKISGDKTWWAVAKTIMAAVLIVLVAVAFVVAASATSGLAAAALKVIAGGAFKFTMGSITMGTLAGGAVVGYMTGVRIGEAWFPDDIYLPVYTLSAEEIFSNNIPLFDVNFFNPMDDKTVNKEVNVDTYTVHEKMYVYYGDNEQCPDSTYRDGIEGMSQLLATEEKDVTGKDKPYYSIAEFVCEKYKNQDKVALKTLMEEVRGDSPVHSEFALAINRANSAIEQKLGHRVEDRIDSESDFKVSYHTEHGNYENNTMLTYTIGKMTTQIESEGADDIVILFVSIKDNKPITTTEKVDTTIVSTAKQLRDVVSKWYFILRNIAILVLMVLLIYSGIRIVLGSTAGEKAKYKERLTDWLVAMCLIMVMHYIMVFSVTIVEKITGLVTGINDKQTNAAYIPLTQEQWNNAKELDWSEFGSKLDGNSYDENGVDGIFIKDSTAESGHAIVWQTNYIGLFRLQAQLENEGSAKWLGYSFCYLILVLFTLFFAYSYIRRIVYMAFLTIIAPMVAMTYPTDKISDNKAQAFDAWLKEYIFNLMIQPLHLLLYTILVSSAFDLVSTNVIYAIVAIGFMMPAEKLMRRFFGYEKAKTPGLLGGAAGAALAMSGLQSILKNKPSGGNSGDSSKNNKDKVKFVRKNSIDEMETIAGKKPAKTIAAPNVSAGQSGASNIPVTNPAHISNSGIPTQNSAIRAGAVNTSGTSGESGTRGRNSIPGENRENIVNPEDHGYGTNSENEPGLTWGMDEDGNNIINLDDYDYSSNLDNASGLTWGMDENEDNIIDMDNYGYGSNLDNASDLTWGMDENGDNIIDSNDYGYNSDNIRVNEEDSDNISSDDDSDATPSEDDAQEEEESATENSDEENSENKRSIWRAVGAVSLGVGRQVATSALKGIHPGRLLGRIVGATAAGAAGLALGVASGDPSKAFQNTVAAGVAGSSLAKALSNASAIDGASLQDDMLEAYYGKEYKDYLVEQEKKEFLNDRENIKYLRKTLELKSDDEAKEIMRTTGEECYNNNITDIADIAAIHKLKNPKKGSGKEEMTFEQAVSARYYAVKRLPGDPDTMTGDKIDRYKLGWANEYIKEGYTASFKEKGYEKEEDYAAYLANKTWDMATEFSKAKSSLTKIENKSKVSSNSPASNSRSASSSSQASNSRSASSSSQASSSRPASSSSQASSSRPASNSRLASNSRPASGRQIGGNTNPQGGRQQRPRQYKPNI